MFETVLSAIRLANHEMAKGNVRGVLIIEMEPREWQNFKRSVPHSIVINTPVTADSCQLEGATVRLKK